MAFYLQANFDNAAQQVPVGYVVPAPSPPQQLPPETVAHWMQEFEAAAVVFNPGSYPCLYCHHPLADGECVVVITRDRSSTDADIPLLSHDNLPSSRWPTAVNRKSHQLEGVHLRCAELHRQQQIHNNTQRILISPGVEMYYQKTEGLGRDQLVQSRHHSKLLITSAYDSVGVLEVFAVAPDILHSLVPGKSGTYAGPDRDPNARIYTAWVTKVHVELAPYIPVLQELIPFEVFHGMCAEGFYYDITMNNHSMTIQKQIAHFQESVKAAIDGVEWSCIACSYIMDSRTTQTESVTIHRLMVMLQLPEAATMRAYRTFMTALWSRSSPIYRLVDLHTAFDETYFLHKVPLPIPRLDGGTAAPDGPLSVKNTVRQWHTTFWGFMRQARLAFDKFDNTLSQELRKKTADANRIKRFSMTTMAVWEHMTPDQKSNQVWSLAYNSQGVIPQFETTSPNGNMYYVFGPPGRPVLGFRFLEPKERERMSEAQPPSNIFIPMMYEDQGCLERELEQIGLHRVELKGLTPLYMHVAGARSPH